MKKHQFGRLLEHQAPPNKTLNIVGQPTSWETLMQVLKKGHADQDFRYVGIVAVTDDTMSILVDVIRPRSVLDYTTEPNTEAAKIEMGP